MIDHILAAATVLVAGATLALLLFARPRETHLLLRAVAALAGATVGVVSLAIGSPGLGLPFVAAGGLLLVLPRHWHLSGALFFAAVLVAFAAYVAYLARATFLLGTDPIGLAVGGILLLLQLAAMLLLLGSAFEMVDALAARPPALPAPTPLDRWPVVCLQVPTYNEPPELVIETIRSLVALDYPALTVQVIDNNTTDEDLWRPVDAECQRLRAAGYRVDFVHLPQWPGYKAGALNWGLHHLSDDVEIVGVVDADYVVEPEWLRATIPHFVDPHVAFVQTPQDYRQWEESAFYRACYAGFALFFKIGMLSRARRNAIIFAGTMGLVRRGALEEVGGWDEQIITEDAELSVRLLEGGWRAVYIPVPCGRGIMPLTYEGLRKQRFRWAFGGIQILRRHWRALLPWNTRSGLSLGQRYDHLMGALWWFNDALTLAFSAFVFAAALGAIFDRPFVVQRLSGIGLVLPLAFIGLNLVRYTWATRVATGAGIGLALHALRVNLSLSWVIAIACLRGLTQERGVFLRTPKFRGAPAIRELRLVWVETAIAAVALLALIGLVLRPSAPALGLPLAVLLAWAVLIYGSATTFALGDPTRRPLSHALRHKAFLELRPRVGRVARAPGTRLAVAMALATAALLIAIAVESSHPPVAELPFADPMERPVAEGVTERPDGGSTAEHDRPIRSTPAGDAGAAADESLDDAEPDGAGMATADRRPQPRTDQNAAAAMPTPAPASSTPSPSAVPAPTPPNPNPISTAAPSPPAAPAPTAEPATTWAPAIAGPPTGDRPPAPTDPPQRP
jgi:cellulose synthase/poly-beta-1,6-N-acetylglucosamine synthase-like glycosyltransferase